MNREGKMLELSDKSSAPSGRRRWLMLGGGAALVAAALGAVLVVSRTQHEQPASKAASEADPAACLAASAPGLVSGAARYGLTYRAEICSQQECASLIELVGGLDARALGTVQGDDRVVRVQLDVNAVSGDLEAPLPSKQALATPMQVRYAAGGSVVDIRYDQQVDVATTRLLESVARELSVSNPACAAERGGSWSAVEELVPARVMSRFQVDPARNQISWRRDRVLVWNDASEIFPLNARSTGITSSEHRASLDDQGQIIRLTGRDDFVLQGEGAGGDLRLRISTDLARQEHANAGAPARAAEPVAPAGFSVPSKHGSVADDARIGGHDVKSIVAELVRTRKVGEENGPGRSRLYVAASALFRRDDAAARQAIDLVRAGHPEQEFLLNALGDAGTAEAASLLADLLQQSSGTPRRATVLGALGRVSAAGVEVVDAMAAVFRDATLGGSARLMVGALAFRTRETSPDTSDKAVQTLIADYSQQSNVLVRADALRALGNAGDVAALRVAKAAASSSNPVERAAAAEALRRIPSDAADRLLATLMTDSVDFVRRSALSAALYRDPTELLAPAAERIARLDTVATVRREAIRVFVRWKPQLQHARSVLAWVATNDPEEDLRKVAAEGLSRFAN